MMTFCRVELTDFRLMHIAGNEAGASGDGCDALVHRAPDCCVGVKAYPPEPTFTST